MKNFSSLIFLAVILTANILAAAETIAIEKFARLPDARDVQISPDGRHLSMVMRKDGKDILIILETAGRNPVSAFPASNPYESIGRVNWVGPERLVYSIAQSFVWRKQLLDFGELYGVNIDASRHEILFGYNAYEQQVGSNIPKKKSTWGHHEIIDLLDDDDKNILIVVKPYSEAISQVYRLNIFNGRQKQIIGLPHHWATAVTDTAGNVRFSIATDDNYEHHVFYRTADAKKWSNFSLGALEEIRPLGFTVDDQHAYVTASADGGTRALYLVNLADMSFEELFHNPDVDISRFIQSFEKDKIVAVATELGVPEYHYLESDDPKAKIHRSLKKAFPGKDVAIVSQTHSGDKFIVDTYSDSSPSSYYLFDKASMKAEYLVSQHQWIDPKLMASTEPVSFDTRDGLVVYGYLTRPLGAAENLPLVVLPHGGPHGVRDDWRYDWQVQLLANRGFAVLTLNFRGSGGFGKDFEESGYRRWGAQMQDDITDATKALIENKTADPKRICIAGFSYGAYAALMGAAREPDLYQCAIGAMGVYDLPDLVRTTDISKREIGKAYLKKALGEDVEDLKRRSPVYHVDKIKADVLLIHGKQDDRAPIKQARSLMAAFDQIDKSYQWLELRDEAHGYYDAKNREEVFSTILEFLEQSIGTK